MFQRDTLKQGMPTTCPPVGNVEHLPGCGISFKCRMAERAINILLGRTVCLSVPLISKEGARGSGFRDVKIKGRGYLPAQVFLLKDVLEPTLVLNLS